MKKLVLIAAIAILAAIVVRLVIQKSGGGETPAAEIDVQIIET